MSEFRKSKTLMPCDARREAETLRWVVAVLRSFDMVTVTAQIINATQVFAPCGKCESVVTVVNSCAEELSS